MKHKRKLLSANGYKFNDHFEVFENVSGAIAAEVVPNIPIADLKRKIFKQLHVAHFYPCQEPLKPMEKHMQLLKFVISDFVLVLELLLDGKGWDETDKLKARRLIDYAQELAGLPKDIGDVAKECGITDYPETEIERLKRDNEKLTKKVKSLTEVFERR